MPTRRTRASAARPVARSRALTFKMPSVSSANFTSIDTWPRGAGLRPLSSSSPSNVFSPKRWLSPWLTRTRTLVWLSIAVTNERERSQGTGVLRPMIVSQ